MGSVTIVTSSAENIELEITKKWGHLNSPWVRCSELCKRKLWTGLHFPWSGYSLDGCIPIEPTSTSPDNAMLNKVNKLNCQQLE